MQRIARLPDHHAAQALAGYDELQRILRRHLPPSAASLYARPKQAAAGIVEWYSELGGQPAPFAELGEQEAVQVRRLLNDRLASIEQLAERLCAQGSEGAHQAGLLRQAASSPDTANLYALNGQPLITAWGGGQPPAKVAPPLVESGEPRRPRWWPWLLLALLLLALAGGWLFCREPTKQSAVAEKEPLPEKQEMVKPLFDREPRGENPEITTQSEPSLPAPKPVPPVDLPAPELPYSDPVVEIGKRIDNLAGDCDALLRLRSEPLLKGNQALRERLERQLTRRCKARLITRAKKLCPDERPKELAPEMVIVFDASGSMGFNMLASAERIAQAIQLPLGGADASLFSEPTRISSAKQATRTVLRQLPRDVNAGLVLVERCPEARSAGYFSPKQRGELLARIDDIVPVAGTPLADGIAKAGAMLDGVNRESVMLVVSDGLESCQRDPCTVARELARAKPYLKINVVDIHGSGAGNCLAAVTGGKVYTVQNIDDLQLMTTQAAEDVLPPAHCRP